MNKAKINYWVDLVIALAFVLSAVSGIVFLLPPGNATALGVSYRVWDQIHIWGSLLMIAGVLAHLVLHWKWIMAMTKKTFLPSEKPARAMTAGTGTLAGRRQFMRTAGVSAVVLGAVAIGYRSLFGSDSTQAGQLAADAGATMQSTATPQALSPAATSIPVTEAASIDAVTEAVTLPTTPVATPPTVSTIELTTQNVAAPQFTVETGQTMTVACHKGIAYDAYPGKCRHYVDSDGDGYCDYSIPTAA